jgi:peptidoglycan/LPS O-acetylase OafA/YrhL
MSVTHVETFSLGQRPSLDGLRCVSIFLVLILHLPGFENILPGGFLGVEIFFVISGFLITSLVVEEFERTGHIDLRNFYLRRVLRLAPALVAVLIFTGFIAFLAGSLRAVGLNAPRLASAIAYFSNWVRAFEGEPGPVWFLAHFWSLSIEEQFYLIWPVSLVFLLRKPRKRVVFIVASLIGVLILFKAGMYLSGASAKRLYYGSDTRADAILIGCLMSLALHWGFFPKVIERYSLILSRGAWVLIAAFALMVQWNDGAVLYLGGFTAVSLACVLIICRLIFFPDRVLSNPLLVWIGKRSYGLYIWHWPIYLLAGALFSNYVAPVALIGTFAFAAVSYRCIEEPFLRLKHRYSTSLEKSTESEQIDDSPNSATTARSVPAESCASEVS